MASLSPIEAPNTELMSALATLLEQGKYSDLTIKCGPRRYAVHRAIICSRSGFFDGAVSHPFRESITGEIDLSEDEPEAVEHMVNYFYHLDYLKTKRSSRSSRASSSAGSRPVSPVVRRSKKLNLALVEDPLLAAAASNTLNVPNSYGVIAPSNPMTPPAEVHDPFGKVAPYSRVRHAVAEDTFDYSSLEQGPDIQMPYLITHAKVYAIAEKYGITGLKALARTKFASQLTVHRDSSELPEALQEVYESTVDTDRGLRDVVIQTFRTYPELARRKDVEAVVKDTPNLAWELFRVGWGMPVTNA